MKKRLFAFAALLMLLTACVTEQPPATTQPTTARPTTQATTTQPTLTTQPTTAPPSGWQTVDGKRVYLNAGVRCTGWQDIDGARYYFDSEGFMATGFVELEDGTYYLDENGNPVIGDFTMDGESYFYNPDGRAYTGFMELDGKTYYFFSNGMMAKGEVKLEDGSRFFDSAGRQFILVNYQHPMRDEYVPTLAQWRERSFETNTAKALKSMLRDGEALGYTFRINSAYRSVSSQQNIWDKRYDQYIAQGMTPEEANREVGLSVAIPGYSEHHTGLAADVDSTWAGLDWLAENCWRYGFVIRYPEGKTEFTGIIYEPWHFRYVGKELAKELYDSGLCLEEYVQMLTAQQGRTIE